MSALECNTSIARGPKTAFGVDVWDRGRVRHEVERVCRDEDTRRVLTRANVNLDDFVKDVIALSSTQSDGCLTYFEHSEQGDQNLKKVSFVPTLVLVVACSKGVTLPLVPVLKASEVSVSDFCKALKQWVSFDSKQDSTMGLPPGFAEGTRTFIADSVSIFAIFRKYQILTNSLELSASQFGAGWLLFLVAKAEIFEGCCTLHNMWLLLLCVLNLLVRAVCQSRSETHAERNERVNAGWEKEAEAIFNRFCGDHAATSAEVRQFEIAKFTVFLRALVRQDRVTVTRPSPRKGQKRKKGHEGSPPEHAWSFTSIFLPANLDTNVERLSRFLDEHEGLAVYSPDTPSASPLSPSPETTARRSESSARPWFWLDERLFLEQQNVPGRTPMKTASPVQPASAPQTRVAVTHRAKSLGRNLAEPRPQVPSLSLFRSLGSGKSGGRMPLSSTFFSSPFRPPASPVTSMLSAVNWLGRVLHVSKRSAVLTVGVSSHGTKTSVQQVPLELAELLKDVCIGVENPSQMAQDVSASLASRVDFGVEDTTHFHRNLAVNLYFFLLTHMLKQERARLQKLNKQVDFSLWMASRSFHASLLCVAFEIIVSSYNYSRFAFPRVLKLFELSSFELIKVIEPAVRALTDLPASIKRHLKGIEFRIVESIAWKKSEVLHTYISNKEYMKPLREAMESMEINPTPAQTIATPAAPRVGGPPPPPRGHKTVGSVFALQVFFRKLWALTADRIRMLCHESLLSVPDELVQLAWAVVKYIAWDVPDLLVDRHLDSIILCSLYAVLNRVAQMRVLTFRRLITLYVSHWDDKTEEVIQHIPITDATGASKVVDVIKFYNEHFVRRIRIRNFLVEQVTPNVSSLQSVGRWATPLGSLTPMPRRAAPTPWTLSDKTLVTVSPLRRRPFSALRSGTRGPARSAISSPPAFMGSGDGRVDYRIGESSSGHLQRINRMVRRRVNFGSKRARAAVCSSHATAASQVVRNPVRVIQTSSGLPRTAQAVQAVQALQVQTVQAVEAIPVDVDEEARPKKRIKQ